MSAASGRVATTVRPRARSEGLVLGDSFDELIVYDRRRHRMHCLGPLLARIWRACNGRRTVPEIAATVRDARVEEDAVHLALIRLRRARLVDDAKLPPVSGSRREALRRVAALGGLALASIASPTALQAATCTPTATCNSSRAPCTGLPCCENPSQRCRAPFGQGRLCGCG